jgi:hypothetical protein
MYEQLFRLRHEDLIREADQARLAARGHESRRAARRAPVRWLRRLLRAVSGGTRPVRNDTGNLSALTLWRTR